MEEVIDFSILTIEDLQEEYLKLLKRFNSLKKSNETDAQRIYELRRSLETANAAEAYLVQELEQFTSAQYNDEAFNKSKQKLQTEYDDLRKKHNDLLTEYTTFQTDYDSVREEKKILQDKLSEMTSKFSIAPVPQISLEQIERENRLERENMELLAKIDESQENLVKYTMAIAEREKNIEILKDQVLCLEENLKSKREELEEKTQLLESTQEQFLEANAKIALLSTAPENSDRKGNSLFAEVDDQRQAMKQLLAAQKKSYLQMKKDYSESEYEIRRLRRENTAMHTELQTCMSIFCNADKMYKQKLTERIKQLLRQSEDLEKKLACTENRLTSLANEKGVVWLDSMLNFCKQETDVLKKQLFSTRIENGILEEQLQKSQQDMAKWRFEALKSRCILLDREDLLNENKIKFKVFTSSEIKLSDKELKAATPRITNAAPSFNCNKVNISSPAKKEAGSAVEEEYLKPKVDALAITSPSLLVSVLEKSSDANHEINGDIQDSIEDENKENVLDVPYSFDIYEDPTFTTMPSDCKPIKVENYASPLKNINEKEAELPPIEKKDHASHLIKADTSCILSTKHVTSSILISKRDIFNDENKKSVKFSADDGQCEIKTKTSAKQTRTKPNLIIRRMFVNSKDKK